VRTRRRAQAAGRGMGTDGHWPRAAPPDVRWTRVPGAGVHRHSPHRTAPHCCHRSSQGAGAGTGRVGWWGKRQVMSEMGWGQDWATEGIQRNHAIWLTSADMYAPCLPPPPPIHPYPHPNRRKIPQTPHTQRRSEEQHPVPLRGGNAESAKDRQSGEVNDGEGEGGRAPPRPTHPGWLPPHGNVIHQFVTSGRGAP